MKKIVQYCVGFVAIVIMGSCSMGQYSYNTMRTTNLNPGVVKLNLTMNDFEYLGTVKVNVSYKTYLGTIRVFDTINGEPYNRRLIREVKLIGEKQMRLSGPIEKAIYKIIETYPDADYYVPAFKDRQTEKMFLGSHSTETVTFKVYRQKNK